MAKNRLIFYCIFGAYQLAAFIFTIVIDSNTSALFSMAGYVPVFKYAAFVGVLLIVVDFAWSWRQQAKAERETEEFRHENNTLKAKIYDLQQPSKQPNPAPAGSK